MTHALVPRGVVRLPGILALFGMLLAAVGLLGLCAFAAAVAQSTPVLSVVLFMLSALLGVIWLYSWRGFVILEPNQAAVALFFGSYSGTLRRDGFHFINPLLTTRRIGLRLQTFETPHLKVNEHGGRPIEIGAVATWSVTEPETALLAVQDYPTFLHQRTEVALREVAAAHPYEAEEGKDCLRGNQTNISKELKARLEAVCKNAGITVHDITITQLAYAPEIAGIMLVKQQAESLLAARRVIVEGAVRIASDAIRQLEAEGHKMPEGEKGRTITNLLTVLASDRGTSPVVSVGA